MTDKEKLQQVRQNLLNQAEDIRQFLDESEETYFRNFQAEIVSNRRVNVTWESNIQGLFDIEYYRPNRDREWQHSVARYREPIPIEDLQTSIGFNSDVADVRLRAVKDGEVIEEFSAKKHEKKPEIKPIKYYGLWDFYAGTSNQRPSDDWKVDGEWPFNAGKSMDKTISHIVDAGLSAIPHGDVFLNNGANIESRVRDVISWADRHSNSVDIIHFMDEPFAKNVNPDQMLHALSYARSRSNKYDYAYTLNVAELTSLTGSGKVRGYGDFDYLWLQVYPYRIDVGNIADTRQALHNELDMRLEQMREIAPDSKYFIVGQGFYSLPGAGSNHKWRMPPDEAPLWYAEWVSNQPDVEGLFYWRRTGGRNDYVMMEHPDFDAFRKNVGKSRSDE